MNGTQTKHVFNIVIVVIALPITVFVLFIPLHLGFRYENEIVNLVAKVVYIGYFFYVTFHLAFAKYLIELGIVTFLRKHYKTAWKGLLEATRPKLQGRETRGHEQ
jgi:pilus assembly protein TadC